MAIKSPIGISGGKDSLTLLYALSILRNFYPKKFDVYAITVKLGIDGMDFSAVEALCKKLDVPYYIIDTKKNDIVFNIQTGNKSMCVMCKIEKRCI